MKMDDKLSEVFDLEPIEYTQISPRMDDIVPTPKGTQEQYIENDFDHVRGNIKELLSTGRSALYDMIEVAKQSEHPRAYEVVGTLMKQLADMNQKLLDAHSQKQKLSGTEKKKEEPASQVTNNAIFVGSTNDLATMIHNMHKGE
jgi:hypothetical protein